MLPWPMWWPTMSPPPGERPVVVRLAVPGLMPSARLLRPLPPAVGWWRCSHPPSTTRARRAYWLADRRHATAGPETPSPGRGRGRSPAPRSSLTPPSSIAAAGLCCSWRPAWTLFTRTPLGWLTGRPCVAREPCWPGRSSSAPARCPPGASDWPSGCVMLRCSTCLRARTSPTPSVRQCATGGARISGRGPPGVRDWASRGGPCGAHVCCCCGAVPRVPGRRQLAAGPRARPPLDVCCDPCASGARWAGCDPSGCYCRHHLAARRRGPASRLHGAAERSSGCTYAVADSVPCAGITPSAPGASSGLPSLPSCRGISLGVSASQPLPGNSRFSVHDGGVAQLGVPHLPGAVENGGCPTPPQASGSHCPGLVPCASTAERAPWSRRTPPPGRCVCLTPRTQRSWVSPRWCSRGFYAWLTTMRSSQGSSA
jgi:hypothetical protein